MHRYSGKIPRKRSVKRRATACVLVSCLGLSTAVAIATPTPPAIADPTREIIAAPSTAQLATAVSSSAHPDSADALVIVQPGSDRYLEEAAALAAGADAALWIANSGSDPASALEEVASKSSKTVYVYGTADYFTSTYTDSIAAHATLDTSAATNSAIDRAAAVSALIDPARIVITSTSSDLEQRLAANEAIGRQSTLLTLDGTETQQALDDFIASHSSVPITLVGEAAATDFRFPDDASTGFSTMPTEDPVSTELGQVEEQTTYGAKASDLFVAPNDQLSSVVLNAYLAHARGGVSMTAGPAATFSADSAASTEIKRLASETAAIHLVGQGITDAQLTTLAAGTQASRTAAPTWRARGATIGTADFKLSWTALSGAAKYVGYDILGNKVFDTAATSAPVTGGQQDVVVSALNSSGKQIGRLELMQNELVTTSDAEGAVIASSVDGSGYNYVQFMGSVKVPRLVTRTMSDPTNPTAAPVETTIALTCQSSFTEKVDPTKQYEYAVRTQGGSDNSACNPEAPREPKNIQSIEASKVTVPMTKFPTTSAASLKASSFDSTDDATDAADAAGQSNAAMPTSNDVQLMSVMGKETAKTDYVKSAMPAKMASAMAAAGPNYAIQYSAYIVEQRIPAPLPFSGNSKYPYLQYAGDNRGYGIPNGPHRVQATMKFMFQNSPQTASLSKNIGKSTEYVCTKRSGGTCVVNNTATASDSGVTWAPHISGSVATATLAVHEPIPFIKNAPAIDAGLYFYIKPGHSTIRGSHDRMPAHEIDSGIIPGEYSVDYISREGPLYCLWGSAPTCTVKVNRSL